MSCLPAVSVCPGLRPPDSLTVQCGPRHTHFDLWKRANGSVKRPGGAGDGRSAQWRCMVDPSRNCDARLGELTCWGTTHVYCQSLPGDPVLMAWRHQVLRVWTPAMCPTRLCPWLIFILTLSWNKLTMSRRAPPELRERFLQTTETAGALEDPQACHWCQR